MEETRINWNTAILAAKKGYKNNNKNENRIGKLTINIPTQSLLQKWIREKHDIHVFVAKDGEYGHPDNSITKDSTFGFYIQQYYNESIQDKETFYNTYEEALEKGLVEALKLIK